MFKILCAKIDYSRKDDLYSIADELKRKEICAFKNEELVIQKLTTYALLQYLLKSEGMDLPVNILYTGKGKPYITDDRFYVSMSHTQEMAVSAISDAPIGIDCESINRKIDYTMIAKKVMTKNELLIFESAAKEEQKIRFTEIWTQKEAYMKFTGNGMGEGFLAIDTTKTSKNYSLRTVKTGNYIIGICSLNNENCVIAKETTGTIIQKLTLPD